MFTALPDYVQRLRIDLRRVTIHNQTLKRTHLLQKQKLETIEEILKEKDKRIKELERKNEKLKKEIEKLTKTKSRYQVSLFDHGNFKHAHEGKKKPNGGQTGHFNTNNDVQRNYASFSHKRIFAKSCGTCGGSLSRTKGLKEKILIDIQINTQLLQMIIESERQWCGNCKKEVRSNHSQSLPFTEYGINTFMVMMYLRFKGKQSHQTIAVTLTSLFGLEISRSGVGTLLSQAKEYLKEKYEELKQAIRNGEIMYNDETGWRVKGKSAWMWIMTTPDRKQTDGDTQSGLTVYVPAESRGKGIMEEMYGKSNAYSMHDGYAGYANTVPKDKQLYCWAHVLRFIHEETMLEKKGSAACIIKERLVTLYQTIRSHPDYSQEQKEQLLKKELNTILAMPVETQTIKNIFHRLKTQKDGLIKALLVTEDGTNNLAERELRPLAISRNISYGSGSYAGMETTAVLASVTQTITRDKTKQYFPTLTSYLREGIQKKYIQYKHIPLFAT